MMLNREISGWQERALKAESECDRMREALQDATQKLALADMANEARRLRLA